jgi:hypothetical protein
MVSKESLVVLIVVIAVVVAAASVSAAVWMGDPREAVLPRRPRFLVLVGLMIVAAPLGMFAELGDGLAASSVSGFAELGGPWVILAFIGGFMVADKIASVIVGSGLLTVAMCAYFAFQFSTNWRARFGWHALNGDWDVTFWMAAAAIAGAIFGLCGWLGSRTHPVCCAAGFSLLAAFLLAETIFSLMRVGEGVSWLLVISEGIAALAVVGFGIWRSSARLFVTAVALTLGVAMALSLLAFATFPVLAAS